VSGLNVPGHPDLLRGLETPDDAGVFRINEDTALVQTLDFLTPVTDDPFDFGRIAAANSLSDVYAMGGRPLTVMNIVCFPSCDLATDILPDILAGGMEKITEAGAVLLGGHSVDDPEIKYGLSVTGIVHPDQILANSTVQAGDDIILTKPVGTGVMSTAQKGGLATDAQVRTAVESMAALNLYAAEAMAGIDIHACTDVTGFGLAGHLLEMAKGGRKHLTLFAGQVPLLDGAQDFAAMGMVPAGAHKNRQFFEAHTRVAGGVDRSLTDLLFDPQTSGGLLVSLPPDQTGLYLEQLEEKGISGRCVGRVKTEHINGFLDIC
tara:strand:+ start:78 stop:1037 length:960 start_codon:yes stop_codon:yes gene_type:complete